MKAGRRQLLRRLRQRPGYRVTNVVLDSGQTFAESGDGFTDVAAHFRQTLPEKQQSERKQNDNFHST
jgi:hypothetical protein